MIFRPLESPVFPNLPNQVCQLSVSSSLDEGRLKIIILKIRRKIYPHRPHFREQLTDLQFLVRLLNDSLYVTVRISYIGPNSTVHSVCSMIRTIEVDIFLTVQALIPSQLSHNPWRSG